MNRYLILLTFLFIIGCHPKDKEVSNLKLIQKALLKHFFNDTNEKLIEKFDFRDSIYIKSLNTTFFDIDYDRKFSVWSIRDNNSGNIFIHHDLDHRDSISFSEKILLSEYHSTDLEEEISVYNLFMSDYFKESMLLNLIVANYPDSLRRNLPRQGLDSLIFCMLTNPNRVYIDLQLSDTSLVTDDTIKKIMNDYVLFKYPIIKESTNNRIKDCVKILENRLLLYYQSNQLITFYTTGIELTAVTIDYDTVYNQYKFNMYSIRNFSF